MKNISLFLCLILFLGFSVYAQTVSEFINDEGYHSYKIEFGAFEKVDENNFDKIKIKKTKSFSIGNFKENRFPSVLNEKGKSVYDFENTINDSFIFSDNKSALILMKKNGNENRIYFLDSVNNCLYKMGDVFFYDFFCSVEKNLFIFIKDKQLYICDVNEGLNIYHIDITYSPKFRYVNDNSISLFFHKEKKDFLYFYEKDENGITSEVFIPKDYKSLKSNFYITLSRVIF